MFRFQRDAAQISQYPVSLMIRKLADGRYRLKSRKKDARTVKRRNLGTFSTRSAALKNELSDQFFNISS